MRCEEAIAAVLDAKEKGLDIHHDIEKHLHSCDNCKTIMAELQQLFVEMDDESSFILPPASVAQNFYRELDKEITGNGYRMRKRNLYRWLAAACILVLAGIGIGYLVFPSKELIRQTAERVHIDTSLTAGFTSESPVQRIQAINRIESGKKDSALLPLLLQILEQDKNTNVRMAAFYAIAPDASDPPVHNRLIQILRNEHEPVIQVLLINVLAEKNEQGSIDAIRAVLQNKNTRKEVHFFAENKIRSL